MKKIMLIITILTLAIGLFATPNPAILNSPANAAINLPTSVLLTWYNGGGAPLGYILNLGTTNPPAFHQDMGLATSYTASNLSFGATYYWQVVPYNLEGNASGCPVWSFSTVDNLTITEFPFIEGFETGNIDQSTTISNWTQATGPEFTEKYWTANSSMTSWGRQPRTGTWNAWLERGGQSWLIRPLELTAGRAYSIELYAHQNGHITDDAKIQVRFGTENSIAGMTTTIIPQTGLTTPPYQRFYGLFTPPTTGTYYIGIQGWINDLINHQAQYISLDDITIEELPSYPVFTYGPTDIDFGAIIVGEQTAPKNITITNSGGGILNIAAADISILGDNADEFSFGNANLPAILGPAQSVVIPVYLTVATEGHISATLRMRDSGTNTDHDVALSANGLQTDIVIIGNGVSNLNLPIQLATGYSYSQSIFLQSEIAVEDCLITKLFYYWNGYAEATSSNDWSIYMGHTALMEFTGGDSWIPLAGLNQVFQGEIALPATPGWIEIPLRAPFLYNNTDNLVIAVDENSVGGDSILSFFFSAETPTNRSILHVGHSPNPDPADPPFGTLVPGHPNVMLAHGGMALDPPDPVTLIAPVNGAIDMPLGGFNLSWFPAPSGGFPESYAVFMSQDEDSIYDDHYWPDITTTSFDPTQAAIDPITYNFGETWYWTVMTFNADGEALQETPFSFTIKDDPRIITLPYSQNFDAVLEPALPEAWTGYIGNTTTYAYVRTYSSSNYASSPPNAVEMNNGANQGADLRLITPDILVPLNSINLSFSARGSNNGFNLLVGTVSALDDSGVFTQLASINLTNTHMVYTVSFADYIGTDQNICIKHGTVSSGNHKKIYIDDIYMEEIVSNDLAVTALSGDGYGVVGTGLSYNVGVYNNGAAAQSSYSVQLIDMLDHTVLTSINVNTPLATNATAEHTLTWTPDLVNTYSIYAKVVLAGDLSSSNDESELMNVHVYAPNTHFSYIGDPESTTASPSIPFNMWYNNNVSETIYMAHEMQIASGTINVIIYKNSFTNDLTKPVKIWMGHTTESENDAWLPFEGYTLVFDGEVHFPGGVNEILIPLQTPFQYTGGNLAVRTNRVHTGDSYSNTNKFFYTTDTSYPRRTRYYDIDNEVINPANPGLLDAGRQYSYVPNTLFIVDMGTASTLDAPAVQIALSGANPRLSWDAVEGATIYVIYGTNNPYDWDEAVEIATTTNLYYTVTTAPAMKFYKVAARSTGR